MASVSGFGVPVGVLKLHYKELGFRVLAVGFGAQAEVLLGHLKGFVV